MADAQGRQTVETSTKNRAPAASKYRIGLISGIFLVVSAFLVDGLQALLELLADVAPAAAGVGAIATPGLMLAGSFLGLVSGIIYIIWFKLLGVDYFGKNAVTKLLTVGGMLVITIIPELDFLPEITAGVVALIVQTYIEDAAGMKG